MSSLRSHRKRMPPAHPSPRQWEELGARGLTNSLVYPWTAPARKVLEVLCTGGLGGQTCQLGRDKADPGVAAVT